MQLDSTTKPELKDSMSAYFTRMQKLRENTKLDSRIRFMIQDVLDLRAFNWVPRTKKEGPKKIEVRVAKEQNKDLWLDGLVRELVTGIEARYLCLRPPCFEVFYSTRCDYN
jgi:hypothetical protein